MYIRPPCDRLRTIIWSVNGDPYWQSLGCNESHLAFITNQKYLQALYREYWIINALCWFLLGFHILVYIKNSDGSMIADSGYYPVTTLNSHKVFVDTVQVKNHVMSSVELTCRGDPGSVYLVSTCRHSTYPAQGISWSIWWYDAEYLI